MVERAPRRMTISEFLTWQADQDDRYELVNGEPVGVAGVPLRHNMVTTNALADFQRQLRAAGSPCDAFTADIGIVTPGGNLRRPDASVQCPPFDEEAMTSDRPRLVLEVLSESTASVDLLVKLDEYKAIGSLDYIVIADPTRVEVAVWFRDPDRGWRHQVLTDPSSVIEMPALGLTLGLATLYERVPLVPRTGPRLVWDDGTDGKGAP